MCIGLCVCGFVMQQVPGRWEQSIDKYLHQVPCISNIVDDAERGFKRQVRAQNRRLLVACVNAWWRMVGMSECMCLCMAAEMWAG